LKSGNRERNDRIIAVPPSSGARSQPLPIDSILRIDPIAPARTLLPRRRAANRLGAPHA